jgi:phosphoserine phosphatase RsbU/P
MFRISARRIVLFLRRTTPLDRIALIIIIFYAGVRVAIAAGAWMPFASLFGFLCFAAIVYFIIRLIPWVRNRLLWSLRNRLIVAYVFMAVVPIVLLLIMVGLGLMLLELQIGAHLFNDNLQDRINIIAADTDGIAAALNREPNLEIDKPVSPSATAIEDPALFRPGVASIIAAAQTQWPDLRAYLNHGQQLVRAQNGGPFAGLAEFRGQLWFACAESLAVERGPVTLLVVAPVTSELLDSFPSKLGPIQISLLDPAPSDAPRAFRLSDGHSYVIGEQVASKNRKLEPAANWLDIRIPGGATLEAHKADTGGDVTPRPVLVTFSLRASAVNRDLLSSVGEYGPFLVDLLIAAASIFLLLELGALAVGIILTRTITSSIADLYEGTLYVRRGDFGHRIRVTKRDQMGALGESFNEMTSSISELIEGQRERQRLENEVSIARDVQQKLFPQTLPSVPGLELAAICKPARVVSGDYYDFLKISPTRVGIVIADISGKGIYASLLMASLQAALRSTSTFEAKCGTAEVVTQLNRHLFKNTSDDQYATLFYAIYDTEAKTLTYTNAGQLAPVFINDGRTLSLEDGGTVVGLFEEATYTECTLSVAAKSLLVAFSDGLTEPESVYGEEFGTERLKAEIVRQRDVPAQRLAENLLAASEQWSGTPEQADDMTVVIARMN